MNSHLKPSRHTKTRRLLHGISKGLSYRHRHNKHKVAVLLSFALGVILVSIIYFVTTHTTQKIEQRNIANTTTSIFIGPSLKAPDLPIVMTPPALHTQGQSYNPSPYIPPEPAIPVLPRYEEPMLSPVVPENNDSPPPSQQQSHAAPKLAIVIDDVGIDRQGTQGAIDLPAPITLAFLPYADHIQSQIEKAYQKGHQIILHMPMQPQNTVINDTGPDALTIGLSPSLIRQRLTTALDAIPHEVGMNNHMGSAFTENSAGMKVVLDVLKERGLFFLDSRTTAHTVGLSLARQIAIPTVGRDVFLDNDVNETAIYKQLQEALRLAKKRGQVVVIGHPHRETIAVLKRELPKLQAQGFILVPVGDLVR